jgi:hypothetical protein
MARSLADFLSSPYHLMTHSDECRLRSAMRRWLTGTQASLQIKNSLSDFPSWSSAISIDHSHVCKIVTEGSHDLFQWKRHLDYIFFMENVPGMIHMLENFDIPIRPVIRKSRHVDDQKIPSEWMYPRWLGNMPFELPLCVDVEDKAAAWRQMLTHSCEHSFPVREASNVID